MRSTGYKTNGLLAVQSEQPLGVEASVAASEVLAGVGGFLEVSSDPRPPGAQTLPAMNIQEKTHVTCGAHTSTTGCGGCTDATFPISQREMWCNGDCQWVAGACVMVHATLAEVLAAPKTMSDPDDAHPPAVVKQQPAVNACMPGYTGPLCDVKVEQDANAVAGRWAAASEGSLSWQAVRAGPVFDGLRGKLAAKEAELTELIQVEITALTKANAPRRV
jgi:hypothetical protein